jgi:hypothetical protein
VSNVRVRVQLATEPGCEDCTADVLRITAVNRGEDGVRLSACAVLSTFGLRMYLAPHLAYPVTVDPGDWCTEWVSCAALARELEARGYEGKTTVVPMFVEDTAPANRALRAVAMTLLWTGGRMNRRGIEHAGEPFVFDTRRWPVQPV